MDRLQLSILLDKYSDALWAAIEATKPKLPAELAETSVGLLGQVYTVYPILELFADLAAQIDEDVSLLRHPEGNE